MKAIKTIFIIFMTISAISAQAELLSHYPFDSPSDPGRDRSENRLHGTAELVDSVQGIIGKAAFFAGHGQIDIETMRDYNWERGLTVSIWVYLKAGGEKYQGIINAGYHDEGSWSVRLSNDRNGLRIFGGVNTLYDSEPVDFWSQPVSYEQWYHVCITYDGVMFRFYLNSERQDADSGDRGPILAKGHPVRMGRQGEGAARFGHLHGIIDDVQVYSTAITAADVKKIYTAGLNGESWAARLSGKPSAGETTAEPEPIKKQDEQRPDITPRADTVEEVSDTAYCPALIDLIIAWRSGDREKAIRELDRISRNYNP